MSQGIEDVNQAANTAPAADDSEQIWFVAVTGDDVRQMTLDQVAESFDAGVVTGQTAVWTEGMEEWAPLGDVADLGDEPSASSPEASAAHSSEVDPAAGGAGGGNAPVSAQPTGSSGFQFSSSEPAVASHGAGHQQHLDVSAATAPAFGAAQALGAAGAGVSVNPSPAPFGQSTVPVALNVMDEEPVPVKKSRSAGKWVIGLLGVAAVGITAVSTGILGDSKKAPKVTVTSTASRAEPAEVLAALPKVEDVQATSDKGLAGTDKGEEARAQGDAPIGALTKVDPNSDESTEKKSLRDGMASSLSGKTATKSKKARKSRRKRRSKSRSSRKSRRRAASKKPEVTRTESAFDPLNGSLP